MMFPQENGLFSTQDTNVVCSPMNKLQPRSIKCCLLSDTCRLPSESAKESATLATINRGANLPRAWRYINTGSLYKIHGRCFYYSRQEVAADPLATENSYEALVVRYTCVIRAGGGQGAPSPFQRPGSSGHGEAPARSNPEPAGEVRGSTYVSGSVRRRADK